MHNIDHPYDQRQYCRLGEKKAPHHPDGIWELALSDFVAPIDPKSYFITSGEAIQKTKKLLLDIADLADKTRKLLKELKKAKGKAVYLETDWTGDGSGLLYLRQKNPRPKSNNPKPKYNKHKQMFNYES